MYPLDVLTNAVRPVTLAGKSYPVRQLKLKEWGELQAWLKSVVPSPVTLAIKALAEASNDGPVPQPVQDALFRQAQEESRRWPPKVGSMTWLKALDEIEGGRARFLRVSLLAGGTDVTEDEAESIVASASLRELMDLMTVCLMGDPPVPKAEGEGTPPSPTIGDGSTNTSAPSVG
jgi:hypothetical protein